MEKNADCVHWKNEHGETPLHCACQCNTITDDTVQTVKYLISKGANVNAQ